MYEWIVQGTRKLISQIRKKKPYLTRLYGTKVLQPSKRVQFYVTSAAMPATTPRATAKGALKLLAAPLISDWRGLGCARGEVPEDGSERVRPSLFVTGVEAVLESGPTDNVVSGADADALLGGAVVDTVIETGGRLVEPLAAPLGELEGVTELAGGEVAEDSLPVWTDVAVVWAPLDVGPDSVAEVSVPECETDVVGSELPLTWVAVVDEDGSTEVSTEVGDSV